MNLEFSESGYSSALSNLEKLMTLGISSPKMEIVKGSMIDYFQVDADVVYMDNTYLIQFHLDEGMLLIQLFQIIKRCSPGTFLILISFQTSLEIQDYGTTRLEELFRSVVSDSSSATVYLFKTLQNK